MMEEDIRAVVVEGLESASRGLQVLDFTFQIISARIGFSLLNKIGHPFAVLGDHIGNGSQRSNGFLLGVPTPVGQVGLGSIDSRLAPELAESFLAFSYRGGLDCYIWRERRMVRCQARGAPRARRYVCETQRRRWPFAGTPRRAAALLLPRCAWDMP